MKHMISVTLAALFALGAAGCKGPDTTTAEATKEPEKKEGAKALQPGGKPTGPIKVGILHSLSGTMAISETSLKDVALMTIDEINQSGGVLGQKLEPVVVDPASNWPLFAEKAKELIQGQHVAVT